MESCLEWEPAPWSVVTMTVDVESDWDFVAGPVASAEVIRLFYNPSVLVRLTDAVLALLEPDLAVSVDLEPMALYEFILIKGPSHWQDVALARAPSERVYPSVD